MVGSPSRSPATRSPSPCSRTSNDRFCEAHVLRDIAASRLRQHDARAQQAVDASLDAAQRLGDNLVWAKARIGLAGQASGTASPRPKPGQGYSRRDVHPAQ
jgi:hypothetical protein